MDLVRAVELEHVILYCAIQRGAAAADGEIEGRGKMAVELGDRDGGVTEVDRPIEPHGKSRYEKPQEAGCFLSSKIPGYRHIGFPENATGNSRLSPSGFLPWIT